MSTILDAKHVGTFLRRLSVEVASVLAVRVLADLVTSYIGPDGAVCDWLREHGPIFYNDFTDTRIVLWQQDGSISATDSDRPRVFRVTDDGAIEMSTTRVILHIGPDTQYGLHDSNRSNWDLFGSYTCTSITSIDGKSLLLSAMILSPGDDFPYDDHVTFNPLRREVKSYPLLTIRDGCVTCCHPSTDVLGEYAKLLEMYAFTGMKRYWTNGSTGRQGVIRLGPGSAHPQFHWTETDTTGVTVQRSCDLEPAVLRTFQPMFPLMRRQGLCINVTLEEGYRDPTKCVYTLVDDRTSPL
jgi:hypothetical protein